LSLEPSQLERLVPLPEPLVAVPRVPEQAQPLM
jgi:hypothetical protein